jgi:acyl dehydratase
MADTLTSITFDELFIGRSATMSRVVGEGDIRRFAAVSGDHNPLHMDAEYAADTQFGERIAHGMFSGALISALIGMEFPGPGAVYLSQSLKFLQPVHIGDQLTVRMEVIERHEDKPIVTMACSVSNQDGLEVVTGEAVVLAPTERITIRPFVSPPE